MKQRSKATEKCVAVLLSSQTCRTYANLMRKTIDSRS